MQSLNLHNEKMKVNVSASALMEEWAKNNKNPTDKECNFYKSARVVPSPWD